MVDYMQVETLTRNHPMYKRGGFGMSDIIKVVADACSNLREGGNAMCVIDETVKEAIFEKAYLDANSYELSDADCERVGDTVVDMLEKNITMDYSVALKDALVRVISFNREATAMAS